MKERNSGTIRWPSVLVVVAILVILIGILLPAVAQMKNAARRTQSLNQLRQLGLSALNYESGHMRFPTASTKMWDSQCEHGWEIALMPNLESNSLVSEMDFDQPWDSGRNSHIYSRYHPLFLNPLEKGMYNSDGYALNHYTANSKVISNTSEPRTLDSVNSTDVLLGEICDGYLPWGQPGNVRPYSNGIKFDSKSYGNPQLSGAGVVFVDASTHWIPSDSQRPEKRTTAAFAKLPCELGGRSSLTSFSCYVDYSPTYAGYVVFFGVHTGWSKSCNYPEGDSLTDDDLHRLERLKNLKGIELGTESSVTEKGAQTLCELTELKHLSLGDVVISDSTMQKLKNLKNLKVLELVDANVSAGELDAFRSALPSCDVRVISVAVADENPTFE